MSVAVGEERAEGECLAGRPVDAVAGFDRLATGVEEPLDGAVDMEVRRRRGDLDAFQLRINQKILIARRKIQSLDRQHIFPR